MVKFGIDFWCVVGVFMGLFGVIIYVLFCFFEMKFVEGLELNYLFVDFMFGFNV